MNIRTRVCEHRAKPGFRFQLDSACPPTIHWETKPTGSMREPRFLPPAQLRFGVRVFFIRYPGFRHCVAPPWANSCRPPGSNRLRVPARRFRPHAVWISSREAGFRPGKARISFPVGQRMPTHHSLGNETHWLHARTAISATHSAPLRGSYISLFVTQGFATAWLHPGLTAAALRALIVCEHQLADFVHTQCGFRPARRDFVRAKPGYRFQLASACPPTFHWETKPSGSNRLRAPARRFRPARRDFACQAKAVARQRRLVGQSPDFVSSWPALALLPFIGKRNTLALCENLDFCHPLSSASGFESFFIRYPGFRHCVAPPWANSCCPPGSNRLRAPARRFRPHAVWISSREAGYRPGKARISFPVAQRTPSHLSLGNETLWLHARTAISTTHSAPLRGSGVFLFVTQGFATAWLHPGLTAAALRAQISSASTSSQISSCEAVKLRAVALSETSLSLGETSPALRGQRNFAANAAQRF